MGAAIAALTDGIDLVRRNPVLLVGAFITTLIVGVGMAISIIPLVGGLVFQLVVLPVALAGMVSMTNAGATGPASFSHFSAGISTYAVSLMGAYALMFIAQLGVGILLLMMAFGLGFGAMSAVGGAEADPGAALGGFGAAFFLVLFVGFVLVLLIALVQQFLDVAVVVGDENASGSLSAALDLITSGPLSVIGYSILRVFVIGFGILLPVGLGIWLIGMGFETDLALLSVAGAVVIAFAIPVGVVFAFAYHVAYYRQRIGADTGTGHTAD